MEKYKDNPDKFKFTNLKKVENPFEDAYCEIGPKHLNLSIHDKWDIIWCFNIKRPVE
jgi:hypothetical protein